MGSNRKTKTDILHELFDGRFVGGSLSELANYSDLFKRMHEAVFLLDRHSLRVLECNPASWRLLKKEESEILGEVFVWATQVEPGLKLDHALPLEFKDQNGDDFYYEITSTTVKILDYIEVIQVMVNDVTEARRAHEALRKLSSTDEMTGLWNFRYFKQKLESLKGEYGIIFLDVDHFKKFNDRNGHPAGDEVLKKVAALLKTSVQRHQIVARYGGEEFVVIAPQATVDETQILAELIRTKIESSKFEYGEFQPLGKVTVSIGVAQFPAHGVTAAEILNQADLALYQSKERGRNQVSIAVKTSQTKPKKVA